VNAEATSPGTKLTALEADGLFAPSKSKMFPSPVHQLTSPAGAETQPVVGATPFPVTVTRVGEVAASVVIVIVALAGPVVRGDKVTLNETVADGAKTRGKDGRLPRVK